MTNRNAYCRECGTTMSELATDCPDCGAPQNGSTGAKTALIAAVVCGFVGLVWYPMIFGPIALVAGYHANLHRGGWLPKVAMAVGVVNIAYAVFVLTEGAGSMV